MTKKKSVSTVKKFKTTNKNRNKLLSRQSLLFALLFAIVGSVYVFVSFAASPAKLTLATWPMKQVKEYVWNNPNPLAPTSCLNEDDWHIRDWTGTINGTFTATEQLCDGSAAANGWDPGGIGLQADLAVVGTLTDLAITSPTGDAHHGVFVDATTYGSGKNAKTLNHYRVCYVPPYSLANNSGGRSIPGGTWKITVSGNVATKDLEGFTLRARMTDVPFQQTYCPPSQQNLI